VTLPRLASPISARGFGSAAAAPPPGALMARIAIAALTAVSPAPAAARFPFDLPVSTSLGPPGRIFYHNNMVNAQLLAISGNFLRLQVAAPLRRC
jgi:hypothetical protein